MMLIVLFFVKLMHYKHIVNITLHRAKFAVLLSIVSYFILMQYYSIKEFYFWSFIQWLMVTIIHDYLLTFFFSRRQTSRVLLFFRTSMFVYFLCSFLSHLGMVSVGTHGVYHIYVALRTFRSVFLWTIKSLMVHTFAIIFQH